MPPHKRQSRQRSLQDAQAASFAQLPEGVLPLIVAHLDAPARKAAALASRALHSAVAPLWGTAAFTMRDSVDAADPKSADALWLMRRLPGLHSLRIESDLHYFGEGLGDGLALLAATLQARPPAFRLRSFSLASVYMDELARHKQLHLLDRVDSFELPDVRCNLDDTEEALYRPLHPFVTSASMSAHPDGEWRDLAAAARFTRLRRLELSVGASLQGSNGGAAVLSAALESLPQLLSLRLEDGSLQPSTDIVQPPFGALLDVAAVPPLSQLTSLELNRVHLQGASFSALSRLTALRQLHVEPPNWQRPNWGMDSMYRGLSALRPLCGLEALTLRGEWWTKESRYIGVDLKAPAAPISLALSRLSGLTALHLEVTPAGLRSKELTLKAQPRLREASLEVIGADMKPVPLSRAFRWIPKTATAVRLWSLQRLSLRGLAIECRPVSSIDDVLACMVQVDRQYARLLCAALPALERLELGLDMQTVHWQELEQLRHLSQAMWDDEFGGWEAGQPSPERLHQPAEAFEFLGGSDGGARAPWVRHCIGAQREILPALRLGPAPRHAEMGWLDLWLNLEYTRQLG